MRKTCRTTVLAFLVALGVLVTAGSAAADTANTSGQTFQNGNCLDVGVTSQCGGWNQTTPGFANRPYVRYLSVTNGGTTTVIIDNTNGDASPLALNGSDVYAVVSPPIVASLAKRPRLVSVTSFRIASRSRSSMRRH